MNIARPRRGSCAWSPMIVTATLCASACGDEAKKASGDTDATTATDTATTPDGAPDGDGADVVAENPWGAPLDPGSPWPKFRRDLAQTGRSDVTPTADPTVARWTFRTAKGIFSTPVIDGDGTVYVGSADRTFYAITAAGEEKWRFQTGEIIDSSALLDDRGHVYFGSGDGHLYALDRQNGQELWRFQADDPTTLGSFIRWFEGNVAILPDGTLVAPNDNFCTYAVDRDTGAKRWCYQTADQTWSLPAVNAETGRIFLGNNFYFALNLHAVDPSNGSNVWTGSALGSVAASPALLGTDATDLLVVGGFDGYVRALSQDTGTEAWAAPLRDHVYASPAIALDGTIIQAGADGTVYALSPVDGHTLWAYDIGAPLRASPAIDGAGHIYLGGGDGRLWVLDADGALRWSLGLVAEDRNDLNASPALGRDGVVIAAESGEIFFVPWDFCLRASEAENDKCLRGPGEALPEAGTELRLTTRFGTVLAEPPATIAPNEALTLTLVQRAAGDTVLAVIDETLLSVKTTPEREVSVVVSGDRRFVSIVPEAPWSGAAGGTLRLEVTGQSLVAPFERTGLKLTGGAPGATFTATFDFAVAASGDAALPLVVPAAPGGAHGVWELARLAAPLPTILPSYNQIGFDSIHYLVGIAAGGSDSGVAWAIGALPEGDGAKVDPTSRVRFPLALTWRGTMVTMDNQAGFGIDFNGFTLPFSRFRVAGTIGATGAGDGAFEVFALAVCGEIDFYGQFLRQLGFCNPESDILAAAGAVEVKLAAREAPVASGVGNVTFSRATGETAVTVTADISGSTLVASEHNLGLLVLDGAGRPAACDYVEGTSVEVVDGHPTKLTLACPAGTDAAEALFMVDVGAAARGAL